MDCECSICQNKQVVREELSGFVEELWRDSGLDGRDMLRVLLDIVEEYVNRRLGEMFGGEDREE